MPAPSMTPATVLTVACTIIVVITGAQWVQVNNLREDTERDLERIRIEIDLEGKRHLGSHQLVKSEAISHANTNRTGMFTRQMFTAEIAIRDKSISTLADAAQLCRTERATMSAVQNQFEKGLNILARKQDTISEDTLPETKASLRSISSRLADVEDDVVEVSNKQDEVREKLIPGVSRRIERIEAWLNEAQRNGQGPRAHYSNGGPR